MTGWGQTGPLADVPGHDINYIAISGALDAIGTRDAGPVPPLNLIGDYGGGALYLAFGLTAALLSARSAGVGQVVDAAMIDGAISLMTLFYGLQQEGVWCLDKASNPLDGGAPYYGVYRCSDGRHISIGPIEPRFYADLLSRIGAPQRLLDEQNDRTKWPEHRAVLAKIFLSRPRDEWTELLGRSDGCFAPVLSMAEAPEHPHLVARESFISVDGVRHPAPAP